MINILVADDHAIIRKGLIEIISDESDLQVCCEAKNSDEVLESIREKKIDIIILDINMPGKSGLDVLKDVKLIKPELPVLILSINPEDQFARRCLRAGAAGYMNKDIEPEEFILAIRKIAKGQKYISASLAEKLLVEAENKQKCNLPHDCLSDREFEVFRMLAINKTITEISDIMSLSVKTISTYKSRIFSKMNFSVKDELINYANKYGLL